MMNQCDVYERTLRNDCSFHKIITMKVTAFDCTLGVITQAHSFYFRDKRATEYIDSKIIEKEQENQPSPLHCSQTLSQVQTIMLRGRRPP